MKFRARSRSQGFRHKTELRQLSLDHFQKIETSCRAFDMNGVVMEFTKLVDYVFFCLRNFLAVNHESLYDLTSSHQNLQISHNSSLWMVYL